MKFDRELTSNIQTMSWKWIALESPTLSLASRHLVSQSHTKLQQVEWSGTTIFTAVYPGGNWAGLFLFL
jgi:hypothetical protein